MHVYFCFHGSKDFFSPPFAFWCYILSALHISFHREKRGRGCATLLSSILSLWSWNSGPKRLELGFSFSLTVWAVCPLLCREVVLLPGLQPTYKSAFGTFVHGGTHGVLLGVEGMG